MRNKVPIIFAIILLSVIIFCLVMFLVVYLNGGTIEMFGIGSRNNVILDRTFELGNIKDIEIKQNAGNIIFKETTDDKIRVEAYGKNENDVQANINGDRLVIDYTIRRFVFFGLGNIKNDIIIYMPTSYSNEITIQNDLGNCEIIDLPNATLDIDCNAGNVEVGKVRNANIKCDLGKVKIDEVLNKCNIEVDSGDVKITNVAINEDSKIKCDLGNIDIKEINDIYIDAKVDLGKTDVNGSNRNANVTLKLECDCGNISVGK